MSKKTLKIKTNTHARLAKHVKLKGDSFDDIIARLLDVYESLPKIRSLVTNAFNAQLNQCMGNTERIIKVKAERAKIMNLLTVR